jgi:hypothetical protein
MGVVILVLVFVGPWLLLGLDIAIRYARNPEQWRADVKLAQRANEAVNFGDSEWSSIRSRGY